MIIQSAYRLLVEKFNSLDLYVPARESIFHGENSFAIIDNRETLRFITSLFKRLNLIPLSGFNVLNHFTNMQSVLNIIDEQCIRSNTILSTGLDDEYNWIY